MRLGISVLFLALLMAGCAKVPISGRKQVNLLPESQMMGMSLEAYNDFLTTNKKAPETSSDAQMVKRVGERIAAATEQFLKSKGMSNRVKDFNWEFNLVEDNTVNAWCMPGGKVVFYTGILPITKTETGLAVVMGHEIAHAIARHGNERMSQQMLVEMGGMGLSLAMQDKPELTQTLFMTSFGLGSSLGVLKFSRQHESEADQMGLTFMALAGYNPEEAVDFWSRMADLGGQKPPEFMSTHPSDQTRIADIKKHLPEALKYYNPSK